MEPHPLTGTPQTSPATPGDGWPGDPAETTTPVATDAPTVATLATTATDLTELAARTSVCRACPRLVEWREDVAIRQRRASFADQPYWGRPVPWFGDPNARFLVVGLAPAANGANRTGRMFTGDRSGEWLYAALHRAGLANRPVSEAAGDGLALRDCRITAPVHCAPPGNKPIVTEQRTCSPWLDAEFRLSAGRLDAVLALGGIAWQAVLQAAARLGWQVPRPRPPFGHGTVVGLRTDTGRPVRLVGCYHVSQQNTFTGRLTEPMLDEALRLLTGGAATSLPTARTGR